MKQYKNVEVESIEELNELINNADCVEEINDLRYACVKLMNNGHPEILKIWQDKYWNLRKCPTCGRLKSN